MIQAKRFWLVALFALGILLTGGDCLAAARHKVIEREDKPAVSFVPAARAREELNAPVLSGLDFTALAPPETRLRIIEDEPYIYVRGDSSSEFAKGQLGLTRMVLLGSSPAGGSYQAQISLRVVPGKDSGNVLRLAFDTAANYVYTHALVAAETRGDTAYALNEVRSPLGLTNPDDKDNRYREYLAYSAAIANPQLWPAVGVSDQNEPAVSGPATPYLFVQGQLMVVRRINRAHCLLTIDITAQDFPHSLALTENIARCIINRIDAGLSSRDCLDYLAYYPEYEPFIAYFEGEAAHPATADLAERPGEGCGESLLPISGDVCAECRIRPSWPASPYTTGLDAAVSGGQRPPTCSKCLGCETQAELPAGGCAECQRCQPQGNYGPSSRQPAKCSPCRTKSPCESNCQRRC